MSELFNPNYYRNFGSPKDAPAKIPLSCARLASTCQGAIWFEKIFVYINSHRCYGGVRMTDFLDRFLAQAAARPRRAAVRSVDEGVTYSDFEKCARQIANIVSRLETPRVLVALPQGVLAYAAMLGVGMGGGFYAPVNVEAPDAKLSLIMRQFEPGLILCDPSTSMSEEFARSGANVVFPEFVAGVDPIDHPDRRNDLAYVMFTSGTTGAPKGVVISRAALKHYTDWLTTEMGFAADDVVSQHPNIAFDLSVMDIFGALCNGATLAPIVSKGDRPTPARAIAREGITYWISVPSVVSLMMRAGHATAAHLLSVRKFAFCGEALLPEQVQALFGVSVRDHHQRLRTDRSNRFSFVTATERRHLSKILRSLGRDRRAQPRNGDRTDRRRERR